MNDPGLLTTFFSVAACMDRQTALPVEVVEIVEDRKPGNCAGSHRPRWTPAEDARLLSLWENGGSAKSMAKFLGRTRGAVEQRLRVIKWERVG